MNEWAESKSNPVIWDIRPDRWTFTFLYHRNTIFYILLLNRRVLTWYLEKAKNRRKLKKRFVVVLQGVWY
jgi:hypothetical protein